MLLRCPVVAWRPNPFGESVVTVKVEPRAHFIGLGALQIVLRGINVLFAVTVPPQLIIGLGLFRGGVRLGNFLRTEAMLRFLRVGAGLLESRLQFFVIEGEKNLSRLYRISLANEHFVDSSAHDRAHAHVPRLHCARAIERRIAMKPTGVDRRGCQNRRHCQNDQQAFPVHGASLLEQVTIRQLRR